MMWVPYWEAGIDETVAHVLNEDIGSGDITAALLGPNVQARATIMSREPMLMCGQAWAERTFLSVDPTLQVTWLVDEGAFLPEAALLCEIAGVARSILTAERTALNFIQTLSGTATLTREYVACLEGLDVQLLDTRKTIPGLRMAQKYAVRCGGGMNHRLGLFDAFLIKENHIKAYGSIRSVIEEARKTYPERLLEIEVETLEELREALDAKPDRVLLDNFTEQMMRDAVKMNQPKRALLEVSGGVNLTTIRSIGVTGVDYISVGAITKSVRAIDLSLLIQDGS